MSNKIKIIQDENIIEQVLQLVLVTFYIADNVVYMWSLDRFKWYKQFSLVTGSRWSLVY